MNFTWDTFEQIAQYWLVGSLILCFLVIAGWRFVECPKTLKLHRKKRKTSWGNAAGLKVYTLPAKLWVGWVVEASLQKFHENL